AGGGRGGGLVTRPLRLGLPGSVAAGTSSVGRRFAGGGAWRIDADELAREAVRPGEPALERIRERWGHAVISADGSLDRDALRRAAFRDPDERAALERIVHGAVGHLREVRRAEARAAGASVVVEEIPLLFEVGLEDEFDAVIAVDAPRATRAERAARHRGWTAEDFRRVEESQLAPAEKRARAHRVIENDGTPEDLEREARALWDDLLAGARRGPAVDARERLS
ncbi:MAG: dephospho-CoA kinase, partial [Gemmatimonadota bacterium]|nr:dephospho-CoA kinase [Gemmatimonadota bacterium]